MVFDEIKIIGRKVIEYLPVKIIHKNSVLHLNPGDTLVFIGSIAGVFSHKVMYIGKNIETGEILFIENHNNNPGIGFVSLNQLKRRYLKNNWKTEVSPVDFEEIYIRLYYEWNKLKQKGYNPIFWNCEHLITYLWHGEGRSTQVNRAIETGTLIALGFIFWRYYKSN